MSFLTLTDAAVAAVDPELRAFASSMPTAYRHAFSAETIAIHAGAAASRKAGAARVVSCGEQRSYAALCVIADDRPGLLWLISIGLAAHELDVMRAHIYCRRRADGRTEAVDLFWVRRRGNAASSPLTESEADALGATINLLLTVDPPPAPDATPGDEAQPSPGRLSTHVSFVVDSETGAAMLVVETPDRPGLLLSVTRALFEENVQIVRAEVATAGAHALDTFYVLELDGGPVTAGRRAEIEAAARTAVLKAR
jgi:[protein-PII] uridylyltransferase